MGWLEDNGAAIGGNILKEAGAWFRQKDAQAYNERMQHDQQDFSRQMWKQTNDYNSPVNQKRLLIEAGLNPNLVYGDGVLGNMAAAATSPAGGASSPVAEGSAWKLYTKAEIDLMKAQADNLRANAEFTRGAKTDETNSRILVNQKTIDQISANLANIDADTQKKFAEIEWGNVTAKIQEMQAEGFRLDNLFKEASMQDSLKKLQAEANLSEAQAKLMPVLLACQINNVKADTVLKNMTTGLTRAQIAHVKNLANLVYQQCEGQKIDNRRNESETSYVNAKRDDNWVGKNNSVYVFLDNLFDLLKGII